MPPHLRKLKSRTLLWGMGVTYILLCTLFHLRKISHTFLGPFAFNHSDTNDTFTETSQGFLQKHMYSGPSNLRHFLNSFVRGQEFPVSLMSSKVKTLMMLCRSASRFSGRMT